MFNLSNRVFQKSCYRVVSFDNRISPIKLNKLFVSSSIHLNKKRIELDTPLMKAITDLHCCSRSTWASKTNTIEACIACTSAFHS